MYRYPDEERILKKGIKAYYFFIYFFKWDVFEKFEYCKQNFDFKTNKERITGTFQTMIAWMITLITFTITCNL